MELQVFEQSLVSGIQKKSPSVHWEVALTVLPVARLPGGGKQPTLSLHCALQSVGALQIRTKKKSENAASECEDRVRCCCLLRWSLSR